MPTARTLLAWHKPPHAGIITKLRAYIVGDASMHKWFITLSFLLLASKALAFEFPIEVIEYMDDVKVVAYIDRHDIDKEKRWHPFQEQPPISIHDALRAVKAFIDSTENFTDITMTGIELKHIPHHEAHWHYLVKVRYRTDGVLKPHFFVVLMDGKVISAIREPESIK
jgi:hypothetical protein